MANIAILAPFEYFVDKTGRPLAGGQIFIGQPNMDPEASPQAAFFDVTGSVAAPQPIQVNAAGYPCDAFGNPARIYTAGPYSLLVKDSTGVHVAFVADSAAGFFGVTASDLANASDPAKGSGLVGFITAAGDAGSTVHDRLLRGWVDAMDYGAKGDGATNDKAAFDKAAATGRAVLLPAGNYLVPSGDYSGTRFYSFDGATCTNGTVTIVDPLAQSLPVGVEVGFSCSPANLPFGWLHEAGQLLNRTAYPQLWAFANASGNIVDEGDKPSNPTAFGRGNGVTTFSLPDRRGKADAGADDGAGVDTSLLLGKAIAKVASSGSGTTITLGVKTPAILAFSTAVNGGNIDIQALQADITDLQAELPLKLDITDDRVPTAWVNFNGTGTVAIRDSHNVSSISDLGTGDYAVNFSAAMADANYSAVANYNSNNAGTTGGNDGNASCWGHATTSVRVLVCDGAGAATDAAYCSAQIMGGK